MALRALAAVAVVTAAVFVAQPVLAGQLLTGDGGARAVHGVIGTEILGTLTLVQLVVAGAATRRRSGRRAPVVVAAALLAAVVVQAEAGYGGDVALHVPLGVVMVGLQVWLAAAVVRTALSSRAHHGSTGPRGRG